jgi:hypothetical protein
MVSDEADDFIREIQINPEATFYTLHEAILHSVGYTNDQMTSFFICDEDWEKGTEVTLEEMDSDSETDTWLMRETPISELIEDEQQKLLYVFDYLTERCFFIELTEIITGKQISKPKCTRSEGNPPAQTIDFDTYIATTSNMDTGENFYGDEDFDIEDFDMDGFDMSDGGEIEPSGDGL